ncbi:hypothetical protein TH66_01000 [Carbonactinospora thermoautotrophica]|uniref:histidine kinase n=1 Tax=Carbonactinospora thermoautotrophica TaxID=1469144 RepID=A0A132N6J6_9ACTN|nr:hypothetical protein TH66_01000 [Carbonactinospora thermoautotrophica]
MPRLRRRNSIGASLVLLVTIPSLALVGLWGFATSMLLSRGLDLRDDAMLVSSAGTRVRAVIINLQEERRLSAVRWVSPRSSRAGLDAQRKRTDVAVEEFHVLVGTKLDQAPSQVRQHMLALDDALDDLARQRSAIDRRSGTSADAFQYYTGAIADGIALFNALSQVSDGDLSRGTHSVVALLHVSELISREDALLSAALASGRFSVADRADFADYARTRRLIHDVRITPDLPDEDRQVYDQITASRDWAIMASVEDAVIEDAVIGDTVVQDTENPRTVQDTESPRTALPSRTREWRTAVDRVSGKLQQLYASSADRVAAEGLDKAHTLISRVVMGSVVGLAAVVVAVLLCVRISRSLLGRLSGLRRATLELADRRLPDVVSRLQRGESVNTAEEVRNLDYGADEVGQVAAAFNTAQHTAVATAVQQAQLREGTKKVFLNIAHRTQVLIHRQIAMLDAMERKHEDPEYLSELFAVDHLATRLRRNAENLAILGGALPGRRWHNPVPLSNVLRSAASEIEDYSRVKLQAVPSVALLGPAVGDVIHLVAELVENATVFSPPHTQVQVGAETVPEGLAIEIEDRGLGMSAEEYQRANELLANPPEFDMMALGEDPRLGLFVVARLAARHGIKVSLHKSPYGGTRAIVLIPASLLQEIEPFLRIPGLPTGARALAKESRVERQDTPPMGSPAAQAGPSRASSDHDEIARGMAAELRSVIEAADAAHRASREARQQGQPESSGPGTRRPLPRRIRQASLAEQLREPVNQHESGGDTVSPERARATMAAIQRGTQQARNVDAAAQRDREQDAGTGAEDEDARTAPSVTKDQR